MNRPVRTILIGHVAEGSKLLAGLRQLSRKASVRRIGNAFKALAFLRHVRDRFVPQLIVLDLQLPRNIGVAVLEQIKRNPTLRHIPVIAVSDSPEDMPRGYRAGANAFVSSDIDYDHLARTVEHLLLPPPPRHTSCSVKRYKTQ